MTAVISAIRPEAPPSHEQFRERIRSSLFEPYLLVPDEFNQSIDSVWNPLLRAFSGGLDYPLNREWLQTDSDRWAAPEGVWAVRGRHPAYPLLDRPSIGADERRYEVTKLFNDGEDVARIAAWLEGEPPPEVLEGFRREHERRTDELRGLGFSSEEIEDAVQGATLEKPQLLESWTGLADFYRRVAENGLWTSCYIG